MAENVRLIGPDKTPVTGAGYNEDYLEAEKIGKVKIGMKALYYKDGLKKYCVPFEYIDRAFTRINACNARTCCCNNSYDYYRLVLVHGEKEFANIIFGADESPVDKAQALLRQRSPTIEIGYIKPEKQ